jgi:hypothetical protein
MDEEFLTVMEIAKTFGSIPSDAAEWAAVYPVSDEEVKLRRRNS